ncbi:MAG: family 2 glycosyl transferase [Syntrophomonadaceae bacterium]|nr:family 2 glycosyl transferase [Syntrophomonadaceae bacterium]
MSRVHIALLTCFSFIMLTLSGCSMPWFGGDNIYEADEGIKLVSRTSGEKISFYADGEWQECFWYGVNLGATTPGHHPGELSPKYEDYRRWFASMEKLGVQTFRIYTILPPDFYRALLEHNRVAEKKLWFIQGIWSPEEELIKEQNAYLPSISQQFQLEIALAVRAVYGQGVISKRAGKASGNYSSNAAPYLLAWMLGSEWDPSMVYNTDKLNAGKPSFQGKYFQGQPSASPFENWLAACLEKLAASETALGWQHPVAFVNWVTTDPLKHPDEPFDKEDMVSVDPMHIKATEDWQAGYFAAYHVYPYYPDFLSYQADYQSYVNRQGEPDPYEAYLVQLRKHHEGIPFIVAEFGVPSSRGMAHRGPLERNQGMHSEKEQGEMNIAMFKAIQNAGGNGGILFAWQDEWFKHTWNTMELEMPGERRPIWLNRLTNEENFGIIAVEPGSSNRVFLDGDLNEWNKIDNKEKVIRGDNVQLTVSSDEAYLFLAIQKNNGWNWSDEELYISFDNQPGGHDFLAAKPGVRFDSGTEFLLTCRGEKEARLEVAGNYDQHLYTYGQLLKVIPLSPEWASPNSGIFLPWRLCLSRELYLPASKRTVPFEDIDIGILHYGKQTASSPGENSLTDFYINANTIEIRIPWMMLGFTDPSSHQVWAYPDYGEDSALSSITSPGLNIQAQVYDKNKHEVTVLEAPLSYNWKNWDRPSYHEREKESYYMLQDFIARAQ